MFYSPVFCMISFKLRQDNEKKNKHDLGIRPHFLEKKKHIHPE